MNTELFRAPTRAADNNVDAASQLADVPAFLDSLVDGRFSIVVCLPGAGISRLLAEAQGSTASTRRWPRCAAP